MVDFLRKNTIALIALAVTVFGTGFAVAGQRGQSSVSISSKPLQACAAGTHRTLNLVSAGRPCPSGQKRVIWNLRGDRGKRGPKGPAGTAGAAGAQGAAGAIGDAGPNGSDWQPDLDSLTGPPGPTGVTGPAGAPGPAGDVGPTGPTGWY